jgi:hypothetical protein
VKLELPGTILPCAARRSDWRTSWSPSLVSLVYALGFSAFVGALAGSMYLLIASFGGVGAAVGAGAWLFGWVWFMGRALVVSERRSYARGTRPLAGPVRSKEAP